MHASIVMDKTRRKFILILASGGGVGFSPFLPGTLGTLVSLPVSLAVNRLAETQPLMALLGLVGLILIAIILADRAARILQIKDPQIIVIDEIAGFAVANFLTNSANGWLIAFVLFRFFDIAKVFPAGRLEMLPGGIGIVLDDIMAGIYTFMILRLLSFASLI
jgi:phosphatidylglycerophosphatase A